MGKTNIIPNVYQRNKILNISSEHQIVFKFRYVYMYDTFMSYIQFLDIIDIKIFWYFNI